MLEARKKQTWKYVGDSVRGAQHERTGQRNQDSITAYVKTDGVAPAILAVSDGHGSPKCFRSHQGSRFAVHAARMMVLRFLSGEWYGSNLSIVKRAVEERLPRDLVNCWQEVVRNHAKGNPFTEAELQQLEKREGQAVREKVQENPMIAYGATLLLVVATTDFILYLQLGDGDILTVAANGDVSRPLPSDERLFANETTSLSGPTSWTDFRSAFQPMSNAAPVLIILSTDGYANSFRDEANFVRVGSDLLQIIREDGLDMVSTSLIGWLSEASKTGSGDDVTVGVLYRADALNNLQTQGATAVSAESVTDSVATTPPAHSSAEPPMPTTNNPKVQRHE